MCYHTIVLFGDLGTNTKSIANLTKFKKIKKFTNRYKDISNIYMDSHQFIDQVKQQIMIPISENGNHFTGVLQKEINRNGSILSVNLQEYDTLLKNPSLYESCIFVLILHGTKRHSYKLPEYPDISQDEAVCLIEQELEQISSLSHYDYIVYADENIKHSLIARSLNRFLALANVNNPREKGANKVIYKNGQWGMLKIH